MVTEIASNEVVVGLGEAIAETRSLGDQSTSTAQTESMYINIRVLLKLFSLSGLVHVHVPTFSSRIDSNNDGKKLHHN